MYYLNVKINSFIISTLLSPQHTGKNLSSGLHCLLTYLFSPNHQSYPTGDWHYQLITAWGVRTKVSVLCTVMLLLNHYWDLLKLSMLRVGLE